MNCGRRMLRLAVAVSAAAVLPAPTFAAPEDGAALLQRVASAAGQLTYSGVFVYRSGTREETSRISHANDAGRSRERIEVLDGSPREVVRAGGQVKCYLPDERLLIVENQSRRRSFPGMLPAGGAGIADNYVVRRGPGGRVAGIDGNSLYLEPRDGYRYGHELWIDPASGLILKASLIGDKGEVLESFAFTQIAIGGPLDRDALSPRFDESKLTVRNVSSNEMRAEDSGWAFRAMAPGFKRTGIMRRPSPGGADGLHAVFSDGLAVISVFIEPGRAEVGGSHFRAGPISLYRRQLDGFHAIVMGEVPPASVKLVGDGIERRGR